MEEADEDVAGAHLNRLRVPEGDLAAVLWAVMLVVHRDLKLVLELMQAEGDPIQAEEDLIRATEVGSTQESMSRRNLKVLSK